MRSICFSLFAVSVANRLQKHNNIDTTNLPECLTIASYKHHLIEDEVVGQCPPSITPGAYYHNENTMNWQCWNDQTAEKVRTDEEAKVQHFDGACVFNAYPSDIQPDDVALCETAGFEDCVTNNDLYWGACFTPGATPTCLPRTADLKGYANGNCKATAVRGKTDELYKDVCQLPKVTVSMYKCDTVKTWAEYDSTVCMNKANGQPLDWSACFSAKAGVNWQCHPKQEDSKTSAFCAGTAYDADPSHKYDGACLFKDSDGYDTSVDWKTGKPDTPPAAKTTTTTTTTTTTKAKSGAVHGAKLVAIVAVVVTATMMFTM